MQVFFTIFSGFVPARQKNLTPAVSRASSRSEARAEAVGVGSSAWFGWGCAPSTAFQNPCTCHAFAPVSHASPGREALQFRANAIKRAPAHPVADRCVPP